MHLFEFSFHVSFYRCIPHTQKSAKSLYFILIKYILQSTQTTSKQHQSLQVTCFTLCTVCLGIGQIMKHECRHFDAIFTTGCIDGCRFDKFGTARDENFVKMTTLPYQVSVWSNKSALQSFKKPTRKIIVSDHLINSIRCTHMHDASTAACTFHAYALSMVLQKIR